MKHSRIRLSSRRDRSSNEVPDNSEFNGMMMTAVYSVIIQVWYGSYSTLRLGALQLQV
jgi:hypothetical protein